MTAFDMLNGTYYRIRVFFVVIVLFTVHIGYEEKGVKSLNPIEKRRTLLLEGCYACGLFTCSKLAENHDRYLYRHRDFGLVLSFIR